MGGALLSGMLREGISKSRILVVDTNKQKLKELSGIKFLSNFNDKKISNFSPDIIIFAVKPQIIDDIIKVYKKFSDKSVFVSIIAGKTIGYFEKHLGSKAAIIRSMPNLPSMISQGITVVCANNSVKNSSIKIVMKIFSLVGKSIKIEGKDEDLLDAVTAVSGSGPAYLFYLIECMQNAAIKLGLPTDIAEELVVQTVYGSAILAYSSQDKAKILRENVTSPKGTTEAALKVLMDNNHMAKLFEKALHSACKRSKELAQ